VQTQQSNRGDSGGGGVDIRRPRNGGNGRWHLTVLAMDEDKTTGDGHSMDVAMDFGEEVARQRRRIL
jgi:hypothetical protein